MIIKFYCPNCEGLTEVESHEIESCINPYQREWDYGSNLLCKTCIGYAHQAQELAKKMINFNEMKVEIKTYMYVSIDTEWFFKEELEDRYWDDPFFGRIVLAKKYIIEDPNYRIMPRYIYSDLVRKYGEGIGYFEDENLDLWRVESEHIETGHYNLFRYYQNELN